MIHAYPSGSFIVVASDGQEVAMLTRKPLPSWYKEVLK